MCNRRNLLQAIGLLPFAPLVSGCQQLFGEGAADRGPNSPPAPYVDRKFGWVWDGQVYREASAKEIDEFIEQMTQEQFGHGRLFMATGSVAADPIKLPDGTWQLPGTLTGVPCPIPDCDGTLVDINQRQYYPFGRDSDGDDDGSSAVNVRFGQCNRCLSRRALPERFDEKAEPLKSQRVNGAVVYPLPAPIGGWLLPRLPAGMRLPTLGRIPIPRFAVP